MNPDEQPPASVRAVDERPPRLPFPLLALCFFGSGATGLVYELLWTRRLQLTFGSTTYSVTTVLAAFMAGLGIGSYLVGRRVDRAPARGARTYALLELGVGVYALLSLPILSGVEAIYGALQSSLQLGQAGATILKFALSFPVLALPAALMGGTLPALVRTVTVTRSALPHEVSRLYGINTVGAATGTALAGLLLIEHLGLWRSMVLAASVNLLIALVVLLAYRVAPRAAALAPEPLPPAPEAPVGGRRPVSPEVLFASVAVVLTGFLSMLYEIVWTRLLTLSLGSSTYAFTIVLAIFLVGIAVGALLYSLAAKSRAPRALDLALLLLALALWVAFTVAAIPALPGTLVRLAQIPGIHHERVLLFEALFATFLLLVPTLLLGAGLPMAMGILSRELGRAGRDVGGAYLANTGGAIVGSVLTGFLLIPLLGTRTTLVAALVLHLVFVGAGVAFFARRLAWRAALVAAVVGAGFFTLAQEPWPPVVYDSGLGFRLPSTQSSSLFLMERMLERTPNKLLHREEGMNATISIRRFQDDISLLINGKPDASSRGDMGTQVILGAVAMVAHPKPEDVCIVGWGSGVTAYTATFFPEMKHLDVIEIEQAVLRTSPFFHLVNGAVEDHPKVRVVYDDARSQFLTGDRRYDLIISEPSNPWMAGVSGLFSKDFYDLAKRRLKPGGVFGQWLQLYRIDAPTLGVVIRTVLDSFPNVQLFHSDPYDVILLASDRPVRFSLARVERAYRADARLPAHMGMYGPGTRPEEFFGTYLIGRSTLEKIAKRFPGPPMTDDRPILEYQSVRSLYYPNEKHLQALWRAKVELGDLQPLIDGPRPPLPLALVGAGAIAALSPPLNLYVTGFGFKRFPSDPDVVLARAKSYYRNNYPRAALAILEKLDGLPAYAKERALLESRALLSLGKADEALAKLEGLGDHRPTVRRLMQLRAALKAGRSEVAWRAVEELLRGLDDPRDLDTRRVSRSTVYSKIGELVLKSKEHARAVRLLESRREPMGGNLDRLFSLLDAYRGLGRRRDAVRILEETRTYGLIDDERLELCEKVYREAGRAAAARVCHEERVRLSGVPEGKTLW
jgi:spermidine synthase